MAPPAIKTSPLPPPAPMPTLPPAPPPPKPKPIPLFSHPCTTGVLSSDGITAPLDTAASLLWVLMAVEANRLRSCPQAAAVAHAPAVLVVAGAKSGVVSLPGGGMVAAFAQRSDAIFACPLAVLAGLVQEEPLQVAVDLLGGQLVKKEEEGDDGGEAPAAPGSTRPPQLISLSVRATGPSDAPAFELVLDLTEAALAAGAQVGDDVMLELHPGPSCGAAVGALRQRLMGGGSTSSAPFKPDPSAWRLALRVIKAFKPICSPCCDQLVYGAQLASIPSPAPVYMNDRASGQPSIFVNVEGPEGAVCHGLTWAIPLGGVVSSSLASDVISKGSGVGGGSPRWPNEGPRRFTLRAQQPGAAARPLQSFLKPPVLDQIPG
jgi:hypothetical protein